MKLLKLLVLAALFAGGWYLYEHGNIQGLEHLKVSLGDWGGIRGSDVLPITRQGDTIRVASFNIQVFGEHKAAKPEVMNILAQVLRNFDVVAIQEVRSKGQDVLPHLLRLINAEGAQYDYVIGPRLGRTDSKEQYAFIFNAASVEIDRESIYTVNDPDDLLQREPLVAGFRVRGPPQGEAFTFTLIDIHTEPDTAQQECNALASVYRAVRNDGRGEDDIILLGDLNSDDHHFGELGRIPYITWAISGMPTNTRGTHLYDNIIFDSRATTEFTGHSGVLDLLRQYNLTMEQALVVSDHMPIWAEFSIREGGAYQHTVAERPDAVGR